MHMHALQMCIGTIPGRCPKSWIHSQRICPNSDPNNDNHPTVTVSPHKRAHVHGIHVAVTGPEASMPMVDAQLAHTDSHIVEAIIAHAKPDKRFTSLCQSILSAKSESFSLYNNFWFLYFMRMVSSIINL